MSDTALERYEEITKENGGDTPLENLRFFCSLAMNGQDWLDVERFIDEVENQSTPNAAIRELIEEAEKIKPLLSGEKLLTELNKLLEGDKCQHGKGLTDYCQPCGRVNNG